MSELRVRLTKAQINFLSEFLEITDGQTAVKRFAEIMTEERLSPKEMSKVIDIIMQKVKKK